MKTAATKLPKKGRGFTWSRGVHPERGMWWRLHRWDENGILHWFIYQPKASDSREDIAVDLRRCCHKLRDLVDDIDLKIMGVTNK